MSRQYETLKQLFPLELGGVHDGDMAVEGGILDRAEASADQLLEQVFADSAARLLTDWERVLGLTPAAGSSTTARLAACVAKIRERGGLSIPYFVELADAMGYTIEVFEPGPFMAGVGCAGDDLYIDQAVFCWRVDVMDDGLPRYEFEAGLSCAGDPLMDFGVQALETVFEELKPAHTFVYFTYPEV